LGIGQQTYTLAEYNPADSELPNAGLQDYMRLSFEPVNSAPEHPPLSIACV
jgi:hypothetical protein